MSKMSLSLMLLLAVITVDAQQLSVASDIQTIPVQAGEAQSTVVPPGKKSACQKGRFLVSIDLRRPPAKGLVVGRDLDHPSAPLIEATFNSQPNAAEYEFGTNDHDLVSLSNGDVFYLTGAFSRRPLNPKPGWFDDTFRGTFGPGARSVLLVWRSTDCGQTFQFHSELDPARVEDGSCAFPQFRFNSGGLDTTRPYDMGGSDGQLVRVDHANDRLYLTFSCVGYQQDKSQQAFTIDSAKPLNKTLIASLSAGEQTWKSLGFLPKRYWRFGIVPFTGNQFAFGLWDLLVFGSKNSSGKLNAKFAEQLAPGGCCWDSSFSNNATIFPLPKQQNPTTCSHQSDVIQACVFAHTIVGRSPGTQNPFIAYPDTIDKKGHGYRLLFYNRKTKEIAEADPILPVKQNSDNFIMHLAAVDLGQGPALLYWNDVNSNTKTGAVRGRLIFGEGQYSDDFAISQANGQPRSWDMTQSAGQYWYGDYLTAAGYVRIPKFQSSSTKTVEYFYYPMWVEPDQTIRYTQVKYIQKTSVVVAPGPEDLKMTKIPRQKWGPCPLPDALTQTRLQELERQRVQEYGRRRHARSLK